MRIGFYGDSKACWAKSPIDSNVSFIDKVCSHYNAELLNQGVPQGSEERVLNELKKTKDPDLIVIFHSKSARFYLPNANRDLDVRDFDQFYDDRKANYIWNVTEEKEKDMAGQYFNYGRIKEKFADIKEFIATISLYKKYLYDPDVHLNRWYGTLIQIDQYIFHKKIPCIHVIDPNLIPSWFEFKSGEVAFDIDQMCEDHYEINPFPNNISIKGQELIADALISKIDKLLHKNSSNS